jgi:hypothetical protein
MAMLKFIIDFAYVDFHCRLSTARAALSACSGNQQPSLTKPIILDLFLIKIDGFL